MPLLHDDYLCLVESGKQQIKEVRRKFNRKTSKQRQLLSVSGFVLRIGYPQLSRDRRIKMKKSINQCATKYEIQHLLNKNCKLLVDKRFSISMSANPGGWRMYPSNNPAASPPIFFTEVENFPYDV